MGNMRFEIWQIDNIRKCVYAFRSWEEAEKNFTINDYKPICNGNIESNNIINALDSLFIEFNQPPYPEEYEGHSLSVSDIVMISDNSKNKIYYCDSFGWSDITNHLKKIKYF